MYRLGMALLFCLCAAQTPALSAAEPFMLTTAEQENKLGAEAYQEILKKEKVCTNKELVKYVQNVSKRVCDTAPDKGFKYEIVVLESDKVNAFCLPGGKIAVYTAILPYCKNEAGLACVLGHEVAHAILRHGGQRMTQTTAVQLFGTGLQALLQSRKVSNSTLDLAMGAYGYGAQLGLLLPYSRNHECEADAEGLAYMTKAGYDPREAPEFWKRFAVLKSDVPSFLNTHPSHEDRADRLTKMLPIALKLYEKSAKLGLGAGIPGLGGTSALAAQPPGSQLPKIPLPGETAALGDAQLRQALQEALSTGFRVAIARLSKEDGFFKDELVKIVMPEKLSGIEKVVRKAGKDDLADKFIVQMNRAAEQAAPGTAGAFAKAIAALQPQDLKAILNGTQDAATQYFRKTVSTDLYAAILPVIRAATESSGATKSYKDMLKKGGFVARMLMGDFDLDEYITTKALDGIFLKLADEEKRIRTEPAARTTDLLRRVFGK